MIHLCNIIKVQPGLHYQSSDLRLVTPLSFHYIKRESIHLYSSLYVGVSTRIVDTHSAEPLKENSRNISSLSSLKEKYKARDI